jgi:hypothetical protein
VISPFWPSDPMTTSVTLSMVTLLMVSLLRAS